MDSRRDSQPSIAASTGPDHTVPERAVTVISWNLQGSQGVDVEGVVEVVGPRQPDIVVLQEVQRAQARRLAAALGMTGLRWAFKHLAWNSRPEGMAVLTPHRLAVADVLVLRRSMWFTWQRRIAIDAVIDRDGVRFGVINVHLSPHDAGARRQREARRVIARANADPIRPFVAGDFNDPPDGPGVRVVGDAGWTDAWTLEDRAGIDGSTNWTAGDRLGRAPTQRLDYVFVPAGWAVEHTEVMAESARHDWFAERSDHLPLLVRMHRELQSREESR